MIILIDDLVYNNILHNLNGKLAFQLTPWNNIQVGNTVQLRNSIRSDIFEVIQVSTYQSLEHAIEMEHVQYPCAIRGPVIVLQLKLYRASK